jgi:hypothetical protein
MMPLRYVRLVGLEIQASLCVYFSGEGPIVLKPAVSKVNLLLLNILFQ